ncbi:hypothetical protein PsYK624_145600 [Phanerochaete sordida]|uniref:Yippee domain-containing protein n=1 Tax=Phanerochaete sordida TaxID=48140 RepID=A0A9P3GMV7_9APHY|nr:hypothetical protein PsYK624_145600 [Phanerochaete sordida]
MHAVMHQPPPVAGHMHAGPSRHAAPAALPRLAVPTQNKQRRSLPDIRSPGGSTMRTEYACRHCRVRIAQRSSVLSWEFRGATGKAALFTNAANVALAKMSVMLMDSGAYRVQNAACAACGEPLGWKFVRAAEQAEKWKEGHLVLELARLDEEAFPLTPLEEVHMPAPARVSVFVRDDSELGHRRSSSSLSTIDRQRPQGPRRRRDS